MRLLKRFDIWIFIFCIFFFSLLPDFDLIITNLFYNEFDFYLKDNYLVRFLYDATNYIGRSIIILLVIVYILSFIKPKIIKRNTILFLLLCAILGPIVVVDAVLKKNWDRPRPYQVIDFGGKYEFEPVFSPTFNCDNCQSFVSGHAAVGFYFLSLALLFRKRRWVFYAVFIGGVIGLGRIVQGGHFLSDVIFSGWVVWFCCLLIYSVFKKYL
jgi:lipid A 4'-phosphatase